MNRRRLSLPLLAVLVALAGCASAQPTKKPGRYVETMTVDQVERSYVLRVPKAYDGNKPLPLVVVLHGWTGSGPLAEIYTGMGEKSEKEGFVAVFPSGLGPERGLGWNAGFIDLSGRGKDDVRFIGELIDRVSKDVKIDPKRVFVCGHSNGAFLSHAVGAQLSDKVAAIGAVAGTTGLDLATPPRLLQNPKGPVSAILIHGKLDPTVTYDHEARGLLKGVSAPNSARWWAKANGITSEPTKETPKEGVVIETWTGGKNGTNVRLVTLLKGGHEWPGGLDRSGPATATGVSAADLLWDFFKANPKR